MPTTGGVTITLSGDSANAILGPQSSTSVVVVDDTAPAPQPSPGPDIDTTAPELLAKAALKRKVLRVRYSCNEACSVRATVGGAARRSARRPTASTAPAPAGCGSA